MLKKNKKKFEEECACCSDEKLTCEPCDCDDIIEGKKE